jgi:hypothetical protein
VPENSGADQVELERVARVFTESLDREVTIEFPRTLGELRRIGVIKGFFLSSWSLWSSSLSLSSSKRCQALLSPLISSRRPFLSHYRFFTSSLVSIPPLP